MTTEPPKATHPADGFIREGSTLKNMARAWGWSDEELQLYGEIANTVMTVLNSEMTKHETHAGPLLFAIAAQILVNSLIDAKEGEVHGIVQDFVNETLTLLAGYREGSGQLMTPAH